jgi:uncharacterized RDD family membrane protein YckC
VNSSGAGEHDAAVNLQGHYAGGVTRLVAFVVDQTLATSVFTVAVGLVAWTISFVTDDQVSLSLPAWLTGSLLVLWLFLYYAYPWTVSGKTAGMALLGIRVVSADGSRCTPPRAALRAVTLPLGFLTLGLGFVPILTGRHRRALYDHIAGTAVVYAWDARAARWRFLARQAEAAQVAGTEVHPSAPG